MKAWPVILVCALWIGACDPDVEPVPPKHRAGATAVIPNPAIDASAQKLDGGLGPAYGAIKAARYEEARRLAEQYVASRGAAARAGQAEFVIGLSFHRQMFYDSASEHFLRALEQEPGFLETYYYAGLSLFNVGRLDEARAAFAVYARYKPEDHALAFGQGLVELEADRVDDAARFLERAIDLATAERARAADKRALDGDLGRYGARLGDVCARRDDFQGAREQYARAATLRPDSPEVWSKLASACERLGDDEGAARARAEAARAEARRAGAPGGAR